MLNSVAVTFTYVDIKNSFHLEKIKETIKIMNG